MGSVEFLLGLSLGRQGEGNVPAELPGPGGRRRRLVKSESFPQPAVLMCLCVRKKKGESQGTCFLRKKSLHFFLHRCPFLLLLFLFFCRQIVGSNLPAKPTFSFHWRTHLLRPLTTSPWLWEPGSRLLCHLYNYRDHHVPFNGSLADCQYCGHTVAPPPLTVIKHYCHPWEVTLTSYSGWEILKCQRLNSNC